jgi:transcription elongation factor GreA
MAMKSITLTKEGHEQLVKELKELKEVKRPEVIARIKSAQELGDLSENAEYQTAKEDQSFVEGRIQELEIILKTAKVVEKQHSTTMVGIGSVVTVDIEGDEVTYEIVGPTESDMERSRISSESPVARALLGRKKGEKVTVLAPGGEVEYKIVTIK